MAAADKLPTGDIGARARAIGVIPKYMAGGYRNPAKKRQRKNGQ